MNQVRFLSPLSNHLENLNQESSIGHNPTSTRRSLHKQIKQLGGKGQKPLVKSLTISQNNDKKETFQREKNLNSKWDAQTLWDTKSTKIPNILGERKQSNQSTTLSDIAQNIKQNFTIRSQKKPMISNKNDHFSDIEYSIRSRLGSQIIIDKENSQSFSELNQKFDDPDQYTFQKSVPLNLTNKFVQVTMFVNSQTGKFANNLESQCSSRIKPEIPPTLRMFTTSDTLPSQNEINQLKDILVDETDFKSIDGNYLHELQMLASLIMFRVRTKSFNPQ